MDLDSVCGGRGICGRCKILHQQGEFAAHGIRSEAEHVSPFSEPEARYARRVPLGPDERLACHARILGDCVVDVPASSQLHRQVVRKPYQSHDIEVEAIVRLHYVEVEPARLEAPRGDLQEPIGTRLGQYLAVTHTTLGELFEQERQVRGRIRIADDEPLDVGRALANMGDLVGQGVGELIAIAHLVVVAPDPTEIASLQRELALPLEVLGARLTVLGLVGAALVGSQEPRVGLGPLLTGDARPAQQRGEGRLER